MDAGQPFQPAAPVVIGLLGGIAAGKSTVAEAFAAHGLVHVDADRIAREVAAEPAVLRELAQAFGPAALRPDGTLDRQAVAALVFADATARRRLEAITHPAIRRTILERIAAARTAGRSVLLDAPLLLEGGLIEQCDATVFVHASDSVRLQRARERGWDAAELARRELAQAALPAKRARATYHLDNDGPLEGTRTQVAAILQQLQGTRP
jgi:dephospho-CoA kinase